MSREDVEVVRGVFEASARRDAAAVLAAYDPEVEIDFSRSQSRFGNLMGGSLYRGHEGLRAWFREWYDAWENVEEECEELIDTGGRVISVMTQRARGRASGLDVELKFAGIWTIRNSRVVRVVWFPTRDEALEAVGLRE